MEEEFRYRGRIITAAEVEFIRQLIAEHPHTNRRQLSLRLCEAWEWKQANGALRDMVCRGLLLQLQRAGRLELPPARQVHRNPAARRATHGEKVLTPLLLDTTPLEAHEFYVLLAGGDPGATSAVPVWRAVSVPA
jgi:hypothetical protein